MIQKVTTILILFQIEVGRLRRIARMILSSLLLPLDRCRIRIIIAESGKNLVDSLSSQVQRVAASKILCTSAKQL